MGIQLRTVGGTLGHRLLAVTPSHANAINHKALLGLVSQTTGLVGARGARGAVADIQLTVLANVMHSQLMFNE